MTAFIHDNVEYVMPTVFKATMYGWARDLIDNGTIYFTNIKRFIEDPDLNRGDRNEGKHVLIRNGIRCTSDPSMPVYVWCCTLDARPCRVIETWADKDCVIQVLDTVEFAKRINGAIAECQLDLWPLQVGPVVYTKTTGGYENDNLADGVFQKDEHYDSQKEFRFALCGRTGQEPEENIILNLGTCNDIVRIALIINPESATIMEIENFTNLSKSEYLRGNYTTSFSLACQALDAASQIVFPDQKTGERFKSIIDDNFDYFCNAGLPGISCKGITFSNSMIKDELGLKNEEATFQEIIYKLIRCSLIHECKLPVKLALTEKTLIGPKDNKFYIPISVVQGLLSLVDWAIKQRV